MKNLNFYLKKSLRWVSFEALSFQLILLVHQMALYRVCPHRFYGLVGTLFSLVYLFVTLSDLGLEASISPFFSTLTKNKNAFRRFFCRQLLPNLLVSIIFFVGAFLLKELLTNKFSILDQVKLPLLCVLAGIVLSETLKKPLRTAMHLAFLNKEVALIEFGTIFCYTSSIWLLIFWGTNITLSLIFMPMLICSVISNGLMASYLYRFSTNLPATPLRLPNLPKRIRKSRGFNYLNHLSHLVFSSNFLVPFFAMQFGLADAGAFKLVSHIAYCTTAVLRKTFGITSDALLAKTKQMSLEAKQAVFLQLTQKVHHALYGVIIFFAINCNKILAYKATGANVISGAVMYLFLAVCLSGIFFIAYEKFYITQEKAGRLLIFNLATMALTYGAMGYGASLSKLSLLLIIIAIRTGMFALLSAASFYTWRLRPQWRLKTSYVAAAIGVSVGFFILF